MDNVIAMAGRVGGDYPGAPNADAFARLGRRLDRIERDMPMLLGAVAVLAGVERELGELADSAEGETSGRLAVVEAWLSQILGRLAGLEDMRGSFSADLAQVAQLQMSTAGKVDELTQQVVSVAAAVARCKPE